MPRSTKSAEDNPRTSYDVVVIGGGAVGLAIAYHLRTHRTPCGVAVIERDPAYSLASTPRASGGVRRLFARPENIELSNYSIPFYEGFPALMAVDGQAPDIGFKKNGYLFIVPPAGVLRSSAISQPSASTASTSTGSTAAGSRAGFPRCASMTLAPPSIRRTTAGSTRTAF